MGSIPTGGSPIERVTMCKSAPEFLLRSCPDDVYNHPRIPHAKDLYRSFLEGLRVTFGPNASDEHKQDVLWIASRAAEVMPDCVGVSTYGFGSDRGGMTLVCRPNIA